MQLVQKLPWAVKNGFDGSNRPQITFPHMHSISGLPALSRTTAPLLSRTAKIVLQTDELGGESAGFEIGVIVPSFMRMPTASHPDCSLKKRGRGLDQVGRPTAFIHQVEELNGDFTFLFACLCAVMSRVIPTSPTIFPWPSLIGTFVVKTSSRLPLASQWGSSLSLNGCPARSSSSSSARYCAASSAGKNRHRTFPADRSASRRPSAAQWHNWPPKAALRIFDIDAVW